LAVVGRDLPLLQDEDANHDNHSDVWTSWNVEWRDLVIVNRQMEVVGKFNLTTYDLNNPENYISTKQILVGLGQGQPLWQNPSNRLDVSGDGQISPIEDVLRLINELNSRKIIDTTGRLPLPMPPTRPGPYYDVSGDGYLSPVTDVLPVINFLNRGAAGEGESVLVAHAETDRTTELISMTYGLLAPFDIQISPGRAQLLSPLALPEFIDPGLAVSEVTPAAANSEQATTDGTTRELIRIWNREPEELLESIRIANTELTRHVVT
jgi:hypothetical protein